MVLIDPAYTFLPEADPSQKFQQVSSSLQHQMSLAEIGCGDTRRRLRQDLRSGVPCQLVENLDEFP